MAVIEELPGLSAPKNAWSMTVRQSLQREWVGVRLSRCIRLVPDRVGPTFPDRLNRRLPRSPSAWNTDRGFGAWPELTVDSTLQAEVDGAVEDVSRTPTTPSVSYPPPCGGGHVDGLNNVGNRRDPQHRGQVALHVYIKACRSRFAPRGRRRRNRGAAHRSSRGVARVESWPQGRHAVESGGHIRPLASAPSTTIRVSSSSSRRSRSGSRRVLFQHRARGCQSSKRTCAVWVLMFR